MADYISNPALRDHVTAARFVLTLGATHIAALAQVEHHLRRNRTVEEDIQAGTLNQRAGEVTRRKDLPITMLRAFRHNHTGMSGLIARGLVEHHYPDKRGDRTRPDEIWTITPAGRAVITLLQKAGIWAEYVGTLPALDPAAAEGRAA